MRSLSAAQDIVKAVTDRSMKHRAADTVSENVMTLLLNMCYCVIVHVCYCNLIIPLYISDQAASTFKISVFFLQMLRILVIPFQG